MTFFIIFLAIFIYYEKDFKVICLNLNLKLKIIKNVIVVILLCSSILLIITLFG